MTAIEVPSLGLLAEQTYPFLAGITAGAAVFAASPALFLYADVHHWHIGEFYVAGFELASVATSFLFTFYTFVVTAERGFIARMRRSIHYHRLIDYTVTALVLGVALIVVSVPMMVIDPTPATRWGWATCVIAAWAVVCVWSLAAFVRSARLFIAFATADS